MCGSFESDAMIDSIKLLDKELIEVKQAAASSTLKPLPGETVIIAIILISCLLPEKNILIIDKFQKA